MAAGGSLYDVGHQAYQIEFSMDISEIRLSQDASLKEALQVLNSSAAQIVLVTDEDNRLLGVVTDGDIRRGLLHGVDLTVPLSKVMNKTPKVLRPSDSAAAGRAAMLRYRVLHMPVVDDDGRVVNLRFLSDPRTGEFGDIPVVLMAGGQGKRLRPLTENMPKPMLRLGGKPILEHILQRFIDQGFRRFYISINYLGHMIEAYFGDGRKWDVSIDYIREEEQLGTAGALSLLPQGVGAPLLVMNGDLITDADFREIVHTHIENRVEATMCIREHRTQIQFGVVETQGDLFVGNKEKPTLAQNINAGIYCLGGGAIEAIPSRVFFDMPSLFQKLTESERRCGVYRLSAVPWLDIGTPDQLEKARKAYDEEGAFRSDKEASAGKSM